MCVWHAFTLVQQKIVPYTYTLELATATAAPAAASNKQQYGTMHTKQSINFHSYSRLQYNSCACNCHTLSHCAMRIRVNKCLNVWFWWVVPNRIWMIFTRKFCQAKNPEMNYDFLVMSHDRYGYDVIMLINFDVFWDFTNYINAKPISQYAIWKRKKKEKKKTKNRIEHPQYTLWSKWFKPHTICDKIFKCK